MAHAENVAAAKRMRRSDVWALEDLAILRAVLEVRPYRAGHRYLIKRWQDVARRVVMDVGMELSWQFCRSRFDQLYHMFVSGQLAHLSPTQWSMLCAVSKDYESMTRSACSTEASTAAQPLAPRIVSSPVVVHSVSRVHTNTRSLPLPLESTNDSSLWTRGFQQGVAWEPREDVHMHDPGRPWSPRIPCTLNAPMTELETSTAAVPSEDSTTPSAAALAKPTTPGPCDGPSLSMILKTRYSSGTSKVTKTSTKSGNSVAETQSLSNPATTTVSDSEKDSRSTVARPFISLRTTNARLSDDCPDVQVGALPTNGQEQQDMKNQLDMLTREMAAVRRDRVHLENQVNWLWAARDRDQQDVKKQFETLGGEIEAMRQQVAAVTRAWETPPAETRPEFDVLGRKIQAMWKSRTHLQYQMTALVVAHEATKQQLEQLTGEVQHDDRARIAELLEQLNGAVERIANKQDRHAEKVQSYRLELEGHQSLAVHEVEELHAAINAERENWQAEFAALHNKIKEIVEPSESRS